jgi:hypothetical protein
MQLPSRKGEGRTPVTIRLKNAARSPFIFVMHDRGRDKKVYARTAIMQKSPA